jgi:hypothetical protein
MPKRRLNPLPLMFMLQLPLLRPLSPETMLKHLTNGLERHALDIRVEEDNEQPADETDAAVEAEGPGGGDAFHHAEESACEGFGWCADLNRGGWDVIDGSDSKKR